MGINLIGAYSLYQGNITLQQLFLDNYADFSVGLIHTAITVLIIDTIYQQRERSFLRRQLLRQVRSLDNNTCLQALDELKAAGWLTKKTLAGERLKGANLENADLANLDLTGVNLSSARLRYAKLSYSTLENAILSDANLQGSVLISSKLGGASLIRANLEESILQGADLRGSIMREAKLVNCIIDGASFDRATILPDGSRWDSSVDMRKFLDPSLV